jgi:hypothetical protein
MPKKFFTERDIELLYSQGVQSLEVTDDLVLTDLAYEKADKLGVKLVKGQQVNPPCAPVRPYIAKESQVSSLSTPAIQPAAQDVDLKKRVRDAVVARLGNQIDANLLDTIIQRVLNNVGVK